MTSKTILKLGTEWFLQLSRSHRQALTHTANWCAFYSVSCMNWAVLTMDVSVFWIQKVQLCTCNRYSRQGSRHQWISLGIKTIHQNRSESGSMWSYADANGCIICYILVKHIYILQDSDVFSEWHTKSKTQNYSNNLMSMLANVCIYIYRVYSIDSHPA